MSFIEKRDFESELFKSLLGNENEICKVFINYDEVDFHVINFLLSRKGKGRTIRVCMNELRNYLTKLLSEQNQNVIFDHKKVYKRLLNLQYNCVIYQAKHKESGLVEDCDVVTVLDQEGFNNPLLDEHNHFCTVRLSDEFFNYITAKNYIDKIKQEQIVVNAL